MEINTTTSIKKQITKKNEIYVEQVLIKNTKIN